MILCLLSKAPRALGVFALYDFAACRHAVAASGFGLLVAGETGALEAFVSVLSGPPGIRPEAIFHDVTGPLLVLWGEDDQVARFFPLFENPKPQSPVA